MSTPLRPSPHKWQPLNRPGLRRHHAAPWWALRAGRARRVSAREFQTTFLDRAAGPRRPQQWIWAGVPFRTAETRYNGVWGLPRETCYNGVWSGIVRNLPGRGTTETKCIRKVSNLRRQHYATLPPIPRALQRCSGLSYGQRPGDSLVRPASLAPEWHQNVARISRPLLGRRGRKAPDEGGARRSARPTASVGHAG